MKVQRNKAEELQIKILMRENDTFRNCFKKDWTELVLEDLRYRMYGKIPRNFLLNISGLIGTPTGIFKSTLGLQIALALDPMFTIKNRVAFSVNDLLDKVKLNSEFYMTEDEFYKFKSWYNGYYDIYDADKPVYKNDQLCKYLVLLRKIIFFLDEQTKTLRIGGMTRLQNLIDTCRERQICFITCGVDTYDVSFSTYDLLRIEESNDFYLPKKRITYAVFDRKRNIYYGYFKWDVTPLTDKLWKIFWDEYSMKKTNFQRTAISQQITSMNFEDYADEIINMEDFEKCVKETKKGDPKLLSNQIRALILRKYPDFTNQERETILSEIKFKINNED